MNNQAINHLVNNKSFDLSNFSLNRFQTYIEDMESTKDQFNAYGSQIKNGGDMKVMVDPDALGRRFKNI